MNLLSCSRVLAVAILAFLLGVTGAPEWLAGAISSDGILLPSTVRFMKLIAWCLCATGVGLTLAVLAWRSRWNEWRRKGITTDFKQWLTTEINPEAANWTRRFTWLSMLSIGLLTTTMIFAAVPSGLKGHLGEGWTNAFLYERGITENLTAFALLCTAVLTAVSIVRWKNWSRLLIPAALFAAMFFLAAGEEASWGQHWLEFETPEALAKINAQGEMNLHNLYSYAGNLSMDVFFFLFVVIHPLLRHWFADIRYLGARLSIPRMPLPLVAWPFLMLFLTERGSFWMPDGLYSGHIQEIREAVFAMVMCCSAIYTYRVWKREHEQQRATPPQRGRDRLSSYDGSAEPGKYGPRCAERLVSGSGVDLDAFQIKNTLI